MIQFITHSNNRYGYVDGARLALEGGCRWVQLRMKEATEAEFMAAAAEIGRLCKEHGATFVLDDHVEWVEKTGADGVHLGKTICLSMRLERYLVATRLLEAQQTPSKMLSACIVRVPTT